MPSYRAATRCSVDAVQPPSSDISQAPEAPLPPDEVSAIQEAPMHTEILEYAHGLMGSGVSGLLEDSSVSVSVTSYGAEIATRSVNDSEEDIGDALTPEMVVSPSPLSPVKGGALAAPAHGSDPSARNGISFKSPLSELLMRGMKPVQPLPIQHVQDCGPASGENLRDSMSSGLRPERTRRRVNSDYLGRVLSDYADRNNHLLLVCLLTAWKAEVSICRDQQRRGEIMKSVETILEENEKLKNKNSKLTRKLRQNSQKFPNNEEVGTNTENIAPPPTEPESLPVVHPPVFQERRSWEDYLRPSSEILQSPESLLGSIPPTGRLSRERVKAISDDLQKLTESISRHRINRP
jgi:hypothetical protein